MFIEDDKFTAPIDAAYFATLSYGAAAQIDPFHDDEFAEDIARLVTAGA